MEDKISVDNEKAQNVDLKKDLKTPSYIRRNVDKYYKKNMTDNEEFKNKRKEYVSTTYNRYRPVQSCRNRAG